MSLYNLDNEPLHNDIEIGEILLALDVLQHQVKRKLKERIKKEKPLITSDEPFEEGELGIHKRYIRRIGQRFINDVLIEAKKKK